MVLLQLVTRLYDLLAFSWKIYYLRLSKLDSQLIAGSAGNESWKRNKHAKCGEMKSERTNKSVCFLLELPDSANKAKLNPYRVVTAFGVCFIFVRLRDNWEIHFHNSKNSARVNLLISLSHVFGSIFCSIKVDSIWFRRTRRFIPLFDWSRIFSLRMQDPNLPTPQKKNAGH